MQAVMDRINDLDFNFLKAVVAVIWAWILDSVGYPGSAITWLIMLCLFDFALGFIRALASSNVSGAKLRRGATKCVWYMCAVFIFGYVDNAVGIALPLPVSIRDLFIAYLAVNEALSCVDHLAFFRVPIPEAFLKRLRRYRDQLTSDNPEGKL